MAVHSKYRVIESRGAELPGRRFHQDPHTNIIYPISGRSFTPQSFATAIRPDIGESEAYKQAMLRGEIGLQRAFGVNVPGVDFITAIREGKNGEKGIMAVVCTDAKTSGIGSFPEPKPGLPGHWRAEAISAGLHPRLSLNVQTTDLSGPALHSLAMPSTPTELKELELAIVDAITHGRIAIRQVEVDASRQGQWSMEGWDDWH
jgi:hypothetical protein